jgi:probable HAF family extracellular repeat protein
MHEWIYTLEPWRTWLGLLSVGVILSGLSCGGDDITQPTTGTLEVTSSTGGDELDPDGYTVQVDAGAPQSIGATSSLSNSNVTAGNHTVELGGIAANCSVAGDNPRTVSITAGQTTTVSFVVTCSSSTGSLQVSSSTSGSSPDPDGYSVTLDGTDRGALGINGSVAIQQLPVGSHMVGLSGIAANCEVAGENPRAVTITAGADATVSFAVACGAPPANAGTLVIQTATTGASLDPDGYTFATDNGPSQPIGITNSVTLSNASPGSHSVELSGIASNCTVSGQNPRAAVVPPGGQATVQFAVSCAAQPSVSYRAVDLGTLGGRHSVAYEINAAGQVVGFADTQEGATHAFRWQAGQMTDLGAPAGGLSMAFGLNASGQVVGKIKPPGGDDHATLWSAGGVTDLGPLGSAEGINAAGQVVGWGYIGSNSEIHAFVWSQGTLTDLGTEGVVSNAYAINGSGQIVGYNTDATRPVLWANGTMSDLGTLGGSSGIAFGINDGGQVVGSSATAQGVTHAFLWQNGTMTDLNAGSDAQTEAYAINASGLVVGARFRAEALRQAVFWENGVMTDLPTLGTEDDNLATGINDAGQIVGWTVTRDGATHATLWTRE